MRLKLELDAHTAALLMRQAVRDLRTVDFEAEYLLREMLRRIESQQQDADRQEVAAC